MVADVLESEGDLADALKNYRDAFAIGEKIGQLRPKQHQMAERCHLEPIWSATNTFELPLKESPRESYVVKLIDDTWYAQMGAET
jgi:hypothetical protein